MRKDYIDIYGYPGYVQRVTYHAGRERFKAYLLDGTIEEFPLQGFDLGNILEILDDQKKPMTSELEDYLLGLAVYALNSFSTFAGRQGLSEFRFLQTQRTGEHSRIAFYINRAIKRAGGYTFYTITQ